MQSIRTYAQAALMLLGLFCFIFAATYVGKAEAQPQVKCKNIMHPDVIQIFPGYRCPRGWVVA